MIVIIDYGMGNLRSVQKGFERVGAQAQIVQKPEPIHQADKLVLPGVGGFSQAMAHLCRQGLVEPLRQFIASGRPFLGICLGLQLLFERSYEEGEHAGLGVLRGQVVRFESVRDAAGQALKVPHMGWNRLEWDRPCPLLDGLRPGTYFYFVHSYYVQPAEAQVVCAWCRYGIDFAAMIWRGQLFATQFHPEKSQRDGLRVLANFARL